MTNDQDGDFDPDEWNWTHPDAAAIEDLERQIVSHPGNRLANRLKELQRIIEAWAGFSMSLSQLLEKCEQDEEFIVELMRNVGDHSKQQWIIRSLDQATIAYVAALGAVIDHSRALVQKQPQPVQDAYEARTSTLLTEHPEGAFLGKLRNYVLHHVAAPWEFSGNMVDPPVARVALTSSVLLESKKAWTRDAKDYITASGGSIHLAPLLGPYLDAMVNHVGLVFPDVVRANAKILRDCDTLVAKRNLLLTGGATDGHDWEARVEHIDENRKRVDRGEPQTDFRTGKPLVSAETHSRTTEGLSGVSDSGSVSLGTEGD